MVPVSPLPLAYMKFIMAGQRMDGAREESGNFQNLRLMEQCQVQNVPCVDLSTFKKLGRQFRRDSHGRDRLGSGVYYGESVCTPIINPIPTHHPS